MTTQQKQFWANRKRAEADGLIRLAMNLENITPRVQMATYEPRIEILIDTAIRLQNEANQLDG